MNKLLKVGIIILLVMSITGCNKENKKEGLNIVTTNFVTYDVARAITGNEANIEMLLKPGSETHTFEPTPKNIIDIENSDMFIYVGGESDEWVDGVLEDIDTSKTKVIKIIDMVDLKEEEIKEGMEHHHHEEGEEHHDEDEDHDHEGEEAHDHDHEAEEAHEHEEVEYDEHVWTSPVNYSKIIEDTSKQIIKIDSKNKETYEKNTKEYVKSLELIHNNFKTIADNATNKTLVFGDRFPFRYFVEEYNLDYYAAFPGCSADTEASASTISFLIDKIKENKMKYILKIELSSDNIAKTISEETDAEILVFNAGHNMSSKDFEKGTTMIDIMESNVKVLEKVLNGTN